MFSARPTDEHDIETYVERLLKDEDLILQESNATLKVNHVSLSKEVTDIQKKLFIDMMTQKINKSEQITKVNQITVSLVDKATLNLK